MPFPRKLLTEGEDIVLDLRPHWIALVWPSVQTILIGVGTGLALGYMPDTWPTWVRWATFLVALALFLAFPVRAVVRWLTSHFVLTTHRLVHRSGWIAKQSMEVPLERINDVRFHQGIFERMIGAGDLVIESAGEHGQELFTDIRRPEHVQRTVYEMAERKSGASTGPTMALRPPAAWETKAESGAATTEHVGHPPIQLSTVEQLERLANLREQGIINDEEFREQKARILGDEEPPA